MTLGPLRPGMRMMRMMRVPTKLGLLALVLFVPLVIISVLLTQRLNDAIDFTRAEIDGAVVVKRVSALVVEVQKHRGLTNMLLSGNTPARTAVLETRGRLQSATTAVEESLATRPDFGLQSRLGRDRAGAGSP